MRCQRRQSTPSERFACCASVYGMATHHHLHGLLRSLAVFTLLDPDAREQAGPFLPHHGLCLRSHDDQDHPRPSHTAALSLVDRNARAVDRRSSSWKPPTAWLIRSYGIGRTVVSASLLCLCSGGLLPVGLAGHQQYLRLPWHQLPDDNTESGPPSIYRE